MLSPLRNRFGIPGVISVIALVFAMLGGAYAASNNQSGKATASAKAKKGPRGPKGATGPAGPQGPAGPAGAKGDAGANGAAGGVGPTGPQGPAGAKGAAGTPGTPGATGATGLSGFTETLPSGKTETGTWSLIQPAFATGTGGASFSFQVASFPIPLEAPVKAVYLNEAETQGEAETEGCKWEQFKPSARPEAPKGTLCVFTEYEVKSPDLVGGLSGVIYTPGEVFEEHKAGPSGAFMPVNMSGGTPEEPDHLSVWGTWAVTAP